MRNRVGPLARGEAAFLTPKTLGCPGACWKQPAVTVVDTTDRPYLTVQLPDGTQLRTHEHNVVRTLPDIRRPRPAPTRRAALTNAEEVPLW